MRRLTLLVFAFIVCGLFLSADGRLIPDKTSIGEELKQIGHSLKEKLGKNNDEESSTVSATDAGEGGAQQSTSENWENSGDETVQPAGGSEPTREPTVNQSEESKVPTDGASSQNGTEQTGEGSENEICFNHIGCFSMDKKWKSALRPIPAPKSPEEMPVTLLLFTRSSPNDPHLIDTFPKANLEGAPFDPEKATAFITHGFTNNGSAQWMHDLKDVYLRKVDANVFITDWGPGAQKSNYLQVAGNTRVVGRLLGNTIKQLISDYGADKKKIHLMGHSLGAQISSYVAKEVPGIGRLTALDPAQPGFETFDKEVRLDVSDADFVDVIHTDAKPFIPTLGFGMMGPHGHVDFYMNGGFQQPGCIVPEPDKIPKIKGIEDLLKFPVEYISEIKSCNHGRAHQYLIEAFNETDDCIFWGHKASIHNLARSITHTLTQGVFLDFIGLSPVCNKDDCAPVGFSTKQSPLRGTFVVTTANREPYCVRENGGPFGDPEEYEAEAKKKPPNALSIKESFQNIGNQIKNLFRPKGNSRSA